MDQGNVVLPGTYLSTIEEFMPGDGTYEKEGAVYAGVVGRTFYDMINRKVNVICFKRNYIQVLRKAKSLLGIVMSVSEDQAQVYIVAADDTRFVRPFSGVLHASQVYQKHVDQITQGVRTGDVIRARPMSTVVPVPLSIKAKEFGVILAYCSQCGSIMKRIDDDHVKCTKCGQVETRKLSSFGMVRRHGSQG
ncbi:RNA-binding protein [Sulfodiicoccus acidiphilus]|uniref:Exosome complex component Csl4 n=1 Tax=Sulfodiicoccus acidiphilus TaxID=1670455 RepID=A0A348B700_9CREN|nr:exosome complex RNA-binding protein Csl4 [Sulfodiicoccus acidiphilus]BBD73952.1 RNA-binding protein [Sulfodiicoccus acidiphilus]GGU03219.1 RNA-binding protein [Sulfodiicoccus acidiphilus]